MLDQCQNVDQMIADGNDDGGDESSKAARSTWLEWVPMEQDLFAGCHLIQLLMIQFVDELFATAQIPYWISGGTLIGALRHEGFVPHDDDVDIECLRADFDAIAETASSRAADGRHPFFSGFVPSAGTWEGFPVAKLTFFGGDFEVDVFPRGDLMDEREDPLCHGKFPSKSEVFPRTRYQFHNINVWGPNRTACRSYLDRLYGNDWRERVLVWNHDFNWYHNKAHYRRRVSMPLGEYNEIVRLAGVYGSDGAHRPCCAEPNSRLTHHKFQTEYNYGNGDGKGDFFERYRSYKSQRTFRRNQSDAEWRYQQQYGD